MRVISGTARGRKLQAPSGRGTRPITDRAKEGIFNMLMSHGEVADATVLDLYAGSGSFGLECVSRGAEHVTFVEVNRDAAATIQRNLDQFGFADRASIATIPVANAIASATWVDLAFCDPPYADDPWAELLPLIKADLLVGHAEREIALTSEWSEIRRKKYGRAKIVLAARIDSR